MGGAFLLEPVVREMLPRELFGPSVILVLRGLHRLRISGTHADPTSQATRLRENDSPGVLNGDWTDCWTIRGPVDPGVLFDAAVEGVLALTLEAALRNAALWSTRSIAQREGLNQAQSTVSGAPSRCDLIASRLQAVSEASLRSKPHSACWLNLVGSDRCHQDVIALR